MKKIIPFLFVLFFCSLLEAQPSIIFNNLTGTTVLNCYSPTININASVTNYSGSGTFLFTWSGPSNTLTGSSVSLTGAGVYSVTAVNATSGYSFTQYLTITSNTVAPTSTVAPLTQNIGCGTAASFTGMGNSTNVSNLTHSWTSPYSNGAAIASGVGTSFYNPTAIGVFTYCVTDISNGCSAKKTVTVTSPPAFPTFSLSSNTQFYLGCGTNTATIIDILNAGTFPFLGGVVTFTVLPPGFTGPYGTGLITSYTTIVPGNYTVVLRDNSTLCEVKLPFTVLQDLSVPQVSVPTPTLSCYQSTAVLVASSTMAATYVWTSGTVSVTGPFITTGLLSNANSSIAAVYTLVATGTVNNCRSTNTITVYQDKFAPTAIINGATGLTCLTTSVNLTLGSITPTIMPWPLPLPIMASAWFGPAPQASLANSSSYQAYVPGTYTMVALNLNNGCTRSVTATVADNRVYPLLLTAFPIPLNCGTQTATLNPAYNQASLAPWSYTWAGPSIMSSVNANSVTVNAPGIYTVSATNTISGCQSVAEMTVTVCALGISENLNSSRMVSFFPNPVRNELTVEMKMPLQNAYFVIYSALGTLVKKQTVTEISSLIDLKNEQTGIYFIHLMQGEKTLEVGKIVKD